MAGVNKVILVGHLGKDPEVRYTPSGQPVANFNIATSESWNDKAGQRQERTEWHRIVVWGKQAELCGEYLAKGRLVYIEGKLQTREWNDRDGNKRYTTEIICSQVNFLGSRGGEAGASGGGARRTTPTSGSDTPMGSSAPSSGGGNNDAGFDYGPPPSDDDVPF